LFISVKDTTAGSSKPALKMKIHHAAFIRFLMIFASLTYFFAASFALAGFAVVFFNETFSSFSFTRNLTIRSTSFNGSFSVMGNCTDPLPVL
jgi:hypothetical protein